MQGGASGEPWASSSAGTSGSGTTSSATAASSSEIDEADIRILRRDGREWVLGRGSFGTVYKALRDDVQVALTTPMATYPELYPILRLEASSEQGR